MPGMILPKQSEARAPPKGFTCGKDSCCACRAGSGVGETKQDARVLGREVLVVAAIPSGLEASNGQRAC